MARMDKTKTVAVALVLALIAVMLLGSAGGAIGFVVDALDDHARSGVIYADVAGGLAIVLAIMWAMAVRKR